MSQWWGGGGALPIMDYAWRSLKGVPFSGRDFMSLRIEKSKKN